MVETIKSLHVFFSRRRFNTSFGEVTFALTMIASDVLRKHVILRKKRQEVLSSNWSL
jgi:hypothetical protein